MGLTSTLQHALTLPAPDRKDFLGEVGRIEYKKCAADPFYWLDPRLHDNIPYVYTVDRGTKFMCNRCKDLEEHKTEHLMLHLAIRHDIKVKNDYEALGFYTKMTPKRPFPYVEKAEYMKPIIEAWLAYRYMCIEKSRDMMATWLAICLYVWDTYFHDGRENIFQSEDANKAYELTTRANYIYINQPIFLRNVHKGYHRKGDAKAGLLDFPTLDSKILGFAQGGDQIRMYHPSGLFQDEAAYQAKAENGFIAVKPALQGGGRYTAVSSANPSFFYLLCSDRSDND